MGELEDKIGQILGDPEQMKKITNIAQSLMGGGNGTGGQSGMPGAGDAPKSTGGGDDDGSPLFDPAMLGKISSLMNAGTGNSRQERALLEAMKPYLSEKRRRKMDKALRLAKLAKAAQLALGEMGEDGGI